jgi:type I restriction enzyme M protein
MDRHPLPKLTTPMLDDIKKTLLATADKLRANMDAAEYKYLVNIGLVNVAVFRSGISYR